MKLGDEEKKVLFGGFLLGTEFALTVVFFIALGKHIGSFFGWIGQIIGIIIGAIVGFFIGWHILLKSAGVQK